MTKQKVEYINHMGDDLSVVNAARVSFDKESKWEAVVWEGPSMEFAGYLNDKDRKLISYLAKHNHWTPFAHTAITLRIKAPVFVRTQCFKHKAGFVENEVSRRYVDSEPEFYTPKTWRGKPTNGAKQGSSGKAALGCHLREQATYGWNTEALHLYNALLSEGVAPEQARMVLPQSMMTEWIWTGNLASYARFCKQRLDSHAQQEIRELAQQVSDIIEPLFLVSWAALTEEAK